MPIVRISVGRRVFAPSWWLTALTIRIGLSVALFLLLMIAWYAGLISPHGLGGH